VTFEGVEVVEGYGQPLAAIRHLSSNIFGAASRSQWTKVIRVKGRCCMVRCGFVIILLVPVLNGILLNRPFWMLLSVRSHIFAVHGLPRLLDV
jgi:hypothetical protein